MREIVDRILQEEQSARSRMERAQGQSQTIILKAKEEAASLIRDAIAKAEELSRNKREESEKGFLAEKDRILNETKESAALSRIRREKDIPGISKDIFLRVITVED